MVAVFRWVSLLFLVASAAAAALVASPSPARGCSYPDGVAHTEPDPYKVAEVIATGRIETDPERNYRSYKFWTFRVERVYKGDIGPRVELRDFPRTNCCDIPRPWYQGDEVFVLAEEVNPTILLLTCRQGSLEEAERIFGTGYEPSSATELHPGDLVSAADGSPAGGPSAALTVGVAALLAVSLLLVRRVRRRSASVAPPEDQDG